ncbi:peptidase [Flavobacterium tructae]|uniref:peptidase n=1 Tax=Flavobacterium tructae TaxID=1114873 RepID=UPI0035A8BEF4
MAKESFFKFKDNFERIKELLKEYLIEFDKEYDEITLSFMSFNIWLYMYEDEDDREFLYINVKYESRVTENVIIQFKEKLLRLGFEERFF